MFEKHRDLKSRYKKAENRQFRGDLHYGKREKKEKFMRVFANVPENMMGDEVISVVDDKPFTWNTAMIEIKNDSESGKKILKMMGKAGII